MDEPTRRALLGTLAGGTVAAIAGCVGGTDDGDDGEPVTDEPDQLQSRLPDEAFPESCPAYDGVDRVVCYDAVDPEAVPALLEPAPETVQPDESIEFTLRNDSDRELRSNFYNWRLHKRVDGDWYHVAPHEYNEPLMSVSPDDAHTWTVSIDNEGIADGEPVPPASGTDRLTLGGVGGGQYAFRARGWFAGESDAESIAFAATFEFDGPPIPLTTTAELEGVEFDGETLVATSTRGNPDSEYSTAGAFELQRVSDVDGDVRSVITEQVLRRPRLRETIALAHGYDADRVRLEEYSGTTPIFGTDADGVYEFQGAYYEVTTTEIEE